MLNVLTKFPVVLVECTIHGMVNGTTLNMPFNRDFKIERKRLNNEITIRTVTAALSPSASCLDSIARTALISGSVFPLIRWATTESCSKAATLKFTVVVKCVKLLTNTI